MLQIADAFPDLRGSWEARWLRTEGPARGPSRHNRLFVHGVLWIAGVGKPSRAAFLKGADHGRLGAARHRPLFVTTGPVLGVTEYSRGHGSLRAPRECVAMFCDVPALALTPPRPRGAVRPFAGVPAGRDPNW
jgi:hypothetical protein